MHERNQPSGEASPIEPCAGLKRVQTVVECCAARGKLEKGTQFFPFRPPPSSRLAVAGFQLAAGGWLLRSRRARAVVIQGVCVLTEDLLALVCARWCLIVTENLSGCYSAPSSLDLLPHGSRGMESVG